MKKVEKVALETMEKAHRDTTTETMEKVALEAVETSTETPPPVKALEAVFSKQM